MLTRLASLAALSTLMTGSALFAQNETTSPSAVQEVIPIQASRTQGTSVSTRRLAATRVMPRALLGKSPLNSVPVRSTAQSTATAQAQLTITTQSYPANAFSPLQSLPVWTFDVKAPRDGGHHLGTIVGQDPFEKPETAKIPTFIVPLIIRTHTVATGIDPTTGIITTQPGETTIDPTKVDNTCLSAPNNIPLALTQESPLFAPAHFVFGGTDVGTTQYIDAFERANFWRVIGGSSSQYHVRLDPVRTLEPILVDVPPNEGLAATDGLVLGPPPFCAPVLIYDLDWFDSYLVGTILPALAEDGVDAASVPIFLAYNAWGAVSSPVTNLANCCFNYHGFAGYPIPNQSYAVVTFDSSAFLSFPNPVTPVPINTLFIAHELGELVNDPFITNETPPWGPNRGALCQDTLEVGDPLNMGVLPYTSAMPPVVMPNGYSYLLQELTFFSWFHGGQSLGVNGWYSNNGTFLTDAGPVCP